MKQAGELGFLGVLVPEEYGGAGLGYVEYFLVIDEISRVDPAVGLSVAAHNSLCTNHILKFGTEEQSWPTVAWVAKVLAPLSTQPPSTFTAFERVPAASEPASGSVRLQAPIFLPVARSGSPSTRSRASIPRSA